MSTYQDEHNIQENSNRNTETQQSEQTQNAGSSMGSLEMFLADSSQSNRGTLQQLMQQALTQYVAGNSDGTPIPDLRIIQDMNALLVDSHAAGDNSVDDEFLDTLERVSMKTITRDKCCPICTNEFHDQDYPLVVRLPCDDKHCFDLDCVGPWLKINKTCPLCRVDVTKKKQIEVPPDSEEEEEGWDMYG